MHDSEDLGIERKIGSMIIQGFTGTSPRELSVKVTLEALSRGLISGVILYSYNIKDPEQLSKLTSEIKLASPSAIISVDQEGGAVQKMRGKNGFTDYPSHAHIAKYCTVSEAREIYGRMAEELSNYNINLNFGPVLDADSQEDPSPIIGAIGRSFSEDPDIVAKYGEAFIDAHREFKIMTAGKHFPGHLVEVDTHLKLADATDKFNEEQLQPFYKLINIGKLDMVMTAHIMNKNFDEIYPASMSENTISKLLRDKGFDGVIISDDLHMGAIQENYSFEKAIIATVAAGSDMMILSNNKQACKNIPNFAPNHKVHADIGAIVKNALKSKQIDESKIDKAAERVRKFKSKIFDG